MSSKSPLKDLAKVVASEMKSGTPGAGLQLAVSVIDRMPDASLELMDNILSESKKKKPNRGLIDGMTLMLGHSLETLRFSVERQHPEALAQAEAIQRRMITMLETEDGDASYFMAILSQFSVAKLEICDELRKVVGRKLETEASKNGDIGALEDHLRQIVDVSNNEFDLFSHLNDFSASLPYEQRAQFAAASFALNIEPVREAAMGWLFDRVREVRAAVVATIHQACSQANPSQIISGAMLRRLIMVRNWVPEAERAAIDEAIKACRMRGIVVSPLRATQVRDIFVSGWDGSGAQSAFIVIQEGRKFGVASVLLKQSMGVRDAWVQHGMTRKYVDDMIAEVSFQVGLMPSTQEYLVKSLGHGLATNASMNVLPPFALLDVIESIGFASIQPAAVSLEELLGQLLDALPSECLASEAVGRALRGSAKWVDLHPGIESWFEDDADVGDVLGRRRMAAAKARAAILDDLLEKRRRKWGELMAWMALALREHDENDGWMDLALVARELITGRPLKDVPVMGQVASATVEAFRNRSRRDEFF